MKNYFGIVVGIMLASGAAQAQSEVGLQIFEDYSTTPETAWAVWSSDTAAPIAVTLVSASPEKWLIDLSNSGHATLGGGGFPFQPNGAFTWIEPEHPGLFNNLYYVDDTHWLLESEVDFAANPENGGFGIFGNGVSIYAGNDVNGDFVYASVTEVPSPGWGISVLGVTALGFARRRR